MDKLKRKKRECLPNARSALYLAALTVVASDGTIVDPEASDIEKIVKGDHDNFDLALKAFRDNSYESCVDLVAYSLNEQQQNALIAVLLDLAMTDGKLAPAEERIILSYVTKFGVPAQEFRNLCHYISMKNNLGLFD